MYKRLLGLVRPYWRWIPLGLVAMVVLAMFGKLRLPGQDKLAARKCPGCGRYRIGKGPCACGKGGRS